MSFELFSSQSGQAVTSNESGQKTENNFFFIGSIDYCRQSAYQQLFSTV